MAHDVLWEIEMEGPVVEWVPRPGMEKGARKPAYGRIQCMAPDRDSAVALAIRANPEYTKVISAKPKKG